MNTMSFSEIPKVPETRFSDCALGKELNSSGETIQKDASYYDQSLDALVADIRNCPLEHGAWEGARGNSKWVPESSYVPQKANPEGMSWSEIMELFGIDGIDFKNGEPTFDKISKGDVIIEGFSENRDDNFDQADIELAEQRGCSPQEVKNWRKENRYTWHECKDMETMQKVPSVIHSNVSHRGGVSYAKAS